MCPVDILYLQYDFKYLLEILLRLWYENNIKLN